ncbi:hypothetical protein AAZX31_18G091000 [Glycine max]
MWTFRAMALNHHETCIGIQHCSFKSPNKQNMWIILSPLQPLTFSFLSHVLEKLISLFRHI